MNDNRPLASFIFIAQTATCQALAVATVVIAWHAFQIMSLSLLASALIATIAATLLSMPTAWRVVNTLLPLAAAATLAIEVPAWIFLAIFACLACVYAPAIWTRVPYYPTPREAYSLILAELPTDRPFTFLDIGCGFGEMLFFLSAHRPLGRFVGIEIGIIPWLIGTARARVTRDHRVAIRFQDMWKEPLSTYDVVYAFLSPAPMERLWDKVVQEMGPNTLFITNTFEAPSPANETVTIRDARRSILYLHRRPSNPLAREVA